MVTVNTDKCYSPRCGGQVREVTQAGTCSVCGDQLIFPTIKRNSGTTGNNPDNNNSDDDVDAVSVTSTDILSASPLFYVLQRMLVTENGTSVADELMHLNKTMKSISQSLEVLATSSSSAETQKRELETRRDKRDARTPKGINERRARHSKRH